ncbi:hypothetical protein CLS_12040 [[Clostridium] cf. saccharolyticum K10]|nr:hypothetical protein CLS_12040 [[Clostridium] cf. saccharolyticum K10]
MEHTARIVCEQAYSPCGFFIINYKRKQTVCRAKCPAK